MMASISFKFKYFGTSSDSKLMKTFTAITELNFRMCYRKENCYSFFIQGTPFCRSESMYERIERILFNFGFAW